MELHKKFIILIAVLIILLAFDTKGYVQEDCWNPDMFLTREEYCTFDQCYSNMPQHIFCDLCPSLHHHTISEYSCISSPDGYYYKSGSFTCSGIRESCYASSAGGIDYCVDCSTFDGCIEKNGKYYYRTYGCGSGSCMVVNEIDCSVGTCDCGPSSVERVLPNPYISNKRILLKKVTSWLDSNEDGNEGVEEYTTTQVINRYSKFNSIEKTQDALGNSIITIYNEKDLPSSGYSEDSSGNKFGNWQNIYYNDGQLKEQTDWNGDTMKYNYDGFNRVTQIFLPGDTEASPPSPSIRYEYIINTNPPHQIKTTKLVDSSKSELTIDFLDGSERVIQTQKKEDSNIYLVKSKEYSVGSLEVKNYNTIRAQTGGNYYSIPGGTPFISYLYYGDPLMRLKEIIYQEGSSTKYGYDISNNQIIQSVTDENNHKSKYYFDSRGNIIRVEEGLDG